jgi:S-formylglutathione hydrolase
MALPGWTETTIGPHSADVFEPSGGADSAIAAIYLHGVHLGRLIDKPAFAEAFNRHGLRVIAPHCGPSWWTDRIYPPFDSTISPEQFVLGPVLDFVAERWNVRPPSVGLFGTSMGGQGALRIGFKHARKFEVVVALAPAIDFHLAWDRYPGIADQYTFPEEARQETATLYAHPWRTPPELYFCCDPRDDEWFEGNERLASKLKALGIRHTSDFETTAGGHGWTYYEAQAPRAIEFLVQGLHARRGALDVLDPRALGDR